MAKEKLADRIKRIKWENVVFIVLGLIMTFILVSFPFVRDVEQKWQNWGTVVGGISQWALVICAIWIGRNYRKFQEIEGAARAELALNVQLRGRLKSHNASRRPVISRIIASQIIVSPVDV
jgi:hypothetical protein